CSAAKALLSWRCGKKKEGEPSQALPSLAASSLLAGVTDKQPIRQLSPITLPGGSKALLPIKERFPISVPAIVKTPFSTRAAPRETLSAMKLSSLMESKSGEMKEAVEISARRPTLAPRRRYQGAR